MWCSDKPSWKCKCQRSGVFLKGWMSSVRGILSVYRQCFKWKSARLSSQLCSGSAWQQAHQTRSGGGGGGGGWLNAACCISMHFARYWSQLELTRIPIVLLLDTWDLILCLILFWSTCHFSPTQYIFGAALPALPTPPHVKVWYYFFSVRPAGCLGVWNM